VSVREKEMGEAFVCLCEDVTLAEVLAAIREGCTNLHTLKIRLRCGMGACQGRTCLRLLACVLARETSQDIENFELPAARPPSRPIPLELLLEAQK
jgi:bacterioferritin-associated ferredoxin